MEDNPTPPPPPAPAVARLPKLPSNAEIVRPRNADVSLLILHAVFSRGPHRPGGTTYRDVAALLWENSSVITGPLFGRFQEWAPTQIQRNMKERAFTIIGHYSAFDPDEVPHPTPLQRLASQLHDEITAISEAEDACRETARLAAELRQAANAQHEGALGLVSVGYGATPLTMNGLDPSIRWQNENASDLLALNPRSQNDQANPIRAQAPPPAAPPGDNVGDIIGVGGNDGVIGDGGGGGAEAVGGARGGRAVHGIVAVPPIATDSIATALQPPRWRRWARSQSINKSNLAD